MHPAPSRRTADPRSVVERYLEEVLNGGDQKVERELVANASFSERLQGFRRAFPDVEVETTLILAEGDVVAVHSVGRGTHRGPFYGIPPTGRRWSATCTALYRVRDGRIADAWVNWDRLAILEQLEAIRVAETGSA